MEAADRADKSSSLFFFWVFVCQLLSPSADASMNARTHALNGGGRHGFPLTDLRHQPTNYSINFTGLQRNPNYPCQKRESELPRVENIKHLEKRARLVLKNFHVLQYFLQCLITNLEY